MKHKFVFQRRKQIESQRNVMLLAVAYAANIGGTGVITGSPPNLVVPQVSTYSSFFNSIGFFAAWGVSDPYIQFFFSTG
jgi:Na+/H+ antiporter NhaD/arsenite permease-like protein